MKALLEWHWLPAMAALFVSPVLAAEITPPDTSQWKCERCPFEREIEASVTSGSRAITGSEYPYGHATGYYDDGLYLELDGRLRTRLGNDRFAADVTALGRGGRRIDLQINGPGQYQGKLTHTEFPARVFDSTRTVFTEISPTELVLPDDWQIATLTSGFSTLAPSLTDRNIESDRTATRFGLVYRPGKQSKLSATLQQRSRQGVDVVGGAHFDRAVLLPRPVDETTTSLDLGATYLLSRGSLSFSFRNEQFRNDAPSLAWDNPFSSPPGAERGQLAGAPDNEIRSLNLAGEIRLQGQTRLSVANTLSRARQDMTFVAYTSNEALASPLPRNSLDGQVTSNNLRLALSGRLSRDTRWRVSYRDDRRENDTPQAIYERVIGESFASADPEANVPYGFESRRLSGRINWRARPGVRIAAGFDASRVERDFQEVRAQDEYGTWGELRWRPSGILNVVLRGGSNRREIDHYDETLAAAQGQNPLLRKYNLAHRFRQFGVLRMSLSPTKQPLQLSAEIEIGENDYSKSRLGVLDSDDHRVALGINWVQKSRVLFADAAVQRMRSAQAGSQSFDAPDWRTNHDDRFTSFMSGVTLPGVVENVDLTAEISWSHGRTEIDVDPAGGSANVFPELESKRFAISARADYHWLDNADLYALIGYEDFATDDWAIDGVDENTIPSVLGLGADPYDYGVFYAGAGVRWEFAASQSE